MENKSSDNKLTASELAELIDKLMEQGSGHININASDDSCDVKVDTCKSTDCTGKKGACCQPTELLDEEF